MVKQRLQQHIAQMTGARYVNLGCGYFYSREPEWINLDLKAVTRHVWEYDLTTGLPLPDNSCDLLYHSHVFEHIRLPDVASFLAECYRVLKPGGVMRTVIPDLEDICRTYLDKLDAAAAGDVAAGADYDWMIIEMWDQAVLEGKVGQMYDYLLQADIPNPDYVVSRIGPQARSVLDRQKNAPRQAPSNPPTPTLKMRLLRGLVAVRQQLLLRLIGRDGLRALEIGRYRLSGDIHHWMYDRYSLPRRLQQAGFVNAVLQSATTSAIPDWSRFNLDTTGEGAIFRPNSLYVEVQKPTN